MKKPLLKSFSFSFLLVLIANPVFAQDPIVFSQFQVNPFQFNPSYAASNGYAEANLLFRQQWSGIENAPTSAAFNVQTPMGRNVSLGLMVATAKTILLNNNTLQGTFGYRVRLSAYQHINFGLSGGLGLNNFDLDAVANVNDPALANVSQKSQYVSGQFGINYTYKNFNVGFSLPTLFDSKPYSIESFQETKFNSFKAKFGSASYAIHVNEDISITPTVLYRALDNQQSQWEGMLVTTYRNFLWLGASYRDGFGITGLIGVRLKGLFRVGYAYEHPTGSISNASNGSHEIYMGARLGKRNREEEMFAEQKKKDSVDQLASVPKEVIVQPITEKRDSLIIAPIQEPTKKDTTSISIIKENDAPVVAIPEVLPVIAEPKETELRGYYVVLGAFRNKENALREIEILLADGFASQIIYFAKHDYYYVYTFNSSDKDTANVELKKILQKKQFSDAWVFDPAND